jgi:hypothetical protein
LFYFLKSKFAFLRADPIPADIVNGQTIPLLEDVFREFPHLTVNIDCKKPETELVDKVRSTSLVFDIFSQKAKNQNCAQ